MTSFSSVTRVEYGQSRLERKLVIVFGFDSYFHEAKASNSGRGRSNYLNTCGDSSSCPNEIYVAVTRAKERCVLLHSEGNAPLPCLDTEKLKNCAEIWGDPETGFATSSIRKTLNSVMTTAIDESMDATGKAATQSRSQMSVKELVFHLPYHVIHKAKQLLSFHFPSSSTFSGLATSTFFKPPNAFSKLNGPQQNMVGPPIDLGHFSSGLETNNSFHKSGTTGPTEQNHGITKQTGDRFESVNEINNLVIALAAELKTRNTCSLLIERVVLDAVYTYYKKGEFPDYETNRDRDLSFAALKKAGENIMDSLERISRHLDPSTLSVSQLLFIANEYIALKTGNQFKLKQIRDYNWITDADISSALKNLPDQISSKAQFNLTVWLKLDPKKMQNVSETSSYSLNQSSAPVIIHSMIDILTESTVILTKSSGSIRDDDVFQLVTVAFLLENGGNLTRAFYSENPRPQDHHSVALGLLQILKSAYKRAKNFHSFTDRSISHVFDEFQAIESIPRSGRKKYMVINAFSGERVEFEFRSIDQLNRAVEAILDYRLGVPEMPVNNGDFVKKVREIIDPH